MSLSSTLLIKFKDSTDLHCLLLLEVVFDVLLLSAMWKSCCGSLPLQPTPKAIFPSCCGSLPLQPTPKAIFPRALNADNSMRRGFGYGECDLLSPLSSQQMLPPPAPPPPPPPSPPPPRTTRTRAGKRQVAMSSSGSAAPPLKRSHIHQLIIIMPQHWRYSQGQGYDRRRAQAMWDYFLQDWHLRLQHKIQTDRPVWCRDKAGVQSMLAADRVADSELSCGTLSASEIRSQHEMVVL